MFNIGDVVIDVGGAVGEVLSINQDLQSCEVKGIGVVPFNALELMEASPEDIDYKVNVAIPLLRQQSIQLDKCGFSEAAYKVREAIAATKKQPTQTSQF